MLESTFTGYYLHSKGWTSTYLYPSNPAFLGCPPTSMNEALVQGMKWMSELFRMSISKFSPFTYGLTSRMSILQTMCYGYFMISPLYFLPMSLYALVPQLCLLSGTPVYPKVSNPWFIWFAIHLIGCLGHHLYEVLTTGASFKAWWNEVRMGMIRSVTANIFGCIDAIMKAIGIKKMDLTLTNKAVDEDQLEKYKKDDFDFQGDKIFIVPLVILVLLNTVSFIGGVGRVIIEGSYDEMFGQIFLSFFILVASYPIIEGIVTGKKNETI
ncbi:hypothetical protein GIB67_028769 [Kingdonia uniflora]|uniref:Cellulose synthase n=1 Tax=Kingdonia uniflora TaxID=39325 RepID=A0A7J7M254_9MAGN|nr:hypothetical protein GIB67_028769 [Kingdonia uniflora]